MARVPVVLALLLASAPAVAQSSGGSWGLSDTTSSGCSTTWTGDCLVSWTGFGDTDSLSAAYQVVSGYGTNDGVDVVGTSDLSPNGITYLLEVPAIDPGMLDVFVESWQLSATLEAYAVIEALDDQENSLGVIPIPLHADGFEERTKDWFTLLADGQDPDVRSVRVTIEVWGEGSELWIDTVGVVWGDPADPPIHAAVETEQDCDDMCEVNRCKSACDLVACTPSFLGEGPPACLVEYVCDCPGDGEDGADELGELTFH